MAEQDPKSEFWFNVQKQSALDSGGAPPTEKPHFETKFESYQDGRKLFTCASGS